MKLQVGVRIVWVTIKISTRGDVDGVLLQSQNFEIRPWKIKFVDVDKNVVTFFTVDYHTIPFEKDIFVQLKNS